MKKISSLLIVAAMATLVACGNNDAANENGAEGAEASTAAPAENTEATTGSTTYDEQGNAAGGTDTTGATMTPEH